MQRLDHTLVCGEAPPLPSQAARTKQYIKADVTTCRGCTSKTSISFWSRASVSLTDFQWFVTHFQHILPSPCLTLLHWKNTSMCVSLEGQKSRTAQSCSTQIELCNIISEHCEPAQAICYDVLSLSQPVCSFILYLV